MDKKEYLMYDAHDYVCDSCGEVGVNGPFTLCEECMNECSNELDKT